MRVRGADELVEAEIEGNKPKPVVRAPRVDQDELWPGGLDEEDDGCRRDGKAAAAARAN